MLLLARCFSSLLRMCSIVSFTFWWSSSAVGSRLAFKRSLERSCRPRVRVVAKLFVSRTSVRTGRSDLYHIFNQKTSWDTKSVNKWSWRLCFTLKKRFNHHQAVSPRSPPRADAPTSMHGSSSREPTQCKHFFCTCNVLSLNTELRRPSMTARAPISTRSTLLCSPTCSLN